MATRGEDVEDEGAPPEFVIVRAGDAGVDARAGGLEGLCEGCGEPALIGAKAVAGKDFAVVPADAAREMDEGAGGVEQDGAYHLRPHLSGETGLSASLRIGVSAELDVPAISDDDS